MSDTMADPLRAALDWLIANSFPMHSTTCAALPDDDPCICNVGEEYEKVLALAADTARPTEPDHCPECSGGLYCPGVTP